MAPSPNSGRPVTPGASVKRRTCSKSTNCGSTRRSIAASCEDRAVPDAEIGVFGGSGFYSFVDVLDEVDVETPYGKPSAPIVIGEVAGRRVAFLPRHGRDHDLPPAQIPYRANVWAMRELGVRRLIGPCASGAL